jgi:hypothetical protein
MKIVEGGYDGPLSGPWNSPKKLEIPRGASVPVREKEPEEIKELKTDNNTMQPESESNSYEENNLRVRIESIPPEFSYTESTVPRSKMKNHFMKKLLSKEGVYFGIVMEQILGRRRGPGRR